MDGDGAGGRGRPGDRRYRTLLYPLPFLIVLVAWSVATYGKLVAPYFLATPTAVVVALAGIARGDFVMDVAISTARISAGFLLSALIALPVGLLIGTSSFFEVTLSPPISFVRYLPVPALVPLCILWFGIGEFEKVMIVFIGVFFQLVLLVADIVKRVPQDLVDISYTLGARPRDALRKVILPYTAPQIFDSLRVSIGWAWGWIILAEIVGAGSGIGFSIVRSQRYLLNDHLLAGLLIVGVLGILTDAAFRVAGRLLFRWKPL